MNLFALALLPWVGALVVACMPDSARRAAAWGAGVVALAVTALVLGAAPAVIAGGVPRASLPWVGPLGLDFGLRLDGLAWLFALLVGAIGALVVLYAAWYLDPAEPARRFFVFLLLFMGAMLGVVLADNLLLLVVFWELTGLASFLLIGWWHGKREAREGARMALAVTAAGGLALLAGVLLIGEIVGSVELDAVLAAGDAIRADARYETALVLVLLGAFAKSAQVPLHFWLPHAMAAPTPVSAYLHSATMVKAGVFLLARLYPALGHSEPWFWIVSSVGAATLVLGAYIAIFQHDLKGLLAYSTISHLGLVTLLLGLDEPMAVVAALFHVVNHATFKAGLFMSAGIIDHETGTRDMRRINGLARAMPVTAALGIVAAAAMAGVPLANGFLSKEMFFAETLALEGRGALRWLLPACAVLAGVFSVAYSTRFVHDVFFNGDPVDLPRTPHEPPWPMRAPVMLLVAVCLAVGLAPQATVAPMLTAASAAALQSPAPAFHLALWHGVNAPLLMSVAAVIGGALLYFGLQRFINLHRLVHVPLALRRGGREVFVFAADRGIAGAAGLTALLQSGSLQRYLALLVMVALAAGFWPFLRAGALPAGALALHLHGLDAATLGVVAVGLAATVGVVACHRQRLTALLLLGVVGLVVCLAFVHFSAPDLALTQLLVEMAGIVLALLALAHLPAESPAEPRLRRWAHGVLAVAAGIGAAALVWLVLGRPFESIAPFFLERALPEGGGANVVNVILVDFRGFDTLGEITVLAIAALIVHAVLADTPPRVPAAAATGASTMLRVVSRLVLPLGLVVALFLFLRGHNLPGGGFIAGLALSLALLVRVIANGLPAHDGAVYRRTLGAGLLLALATGLGAWAFGAPLLTSTYDYPWLVGIGGVPLASASLFDLGVWLVVTGATMTMLLVLARLRGGSGA